MEKESIGEVSNYDLRTSYLQELKQFMMLEPGAASEMPTNKKIDAYLGYEKRFSSQLQYLLNHETPKTLQSRKSQEI